jgi:AraC-like DNA-binding protein
MQNVKVGTIKALRLRASTSTPSVAAEVLAELFDHAPDLAFFVKDAAGRYLAVNHSLVKRHGFLHKAQVLHRRPCEICRGEFGRLPAEQDERVLRTGVSLVDHLEQQWYLPQKPVWCLTTKLPLRDTTGKVVGLVGISRDLRAPVNPREIPPGVARVLDYFENNLSEPVSSSSLARQANLPPARFARLIRRFFDLTPSQLITQTRLTAATRFLRESQDSVADVAFRCGFYDHSAFSRAFQRAMGVTPSDYRRACVHFQDTKDP